MDALLPNPSNYPIIVFVVKLMRVCSFCSSPYTISTLHFTLAYDSSLQSIAYFDSMGGKNISCLKVN